MSFIEGLTRKDGYQPRPDDKFPQIHPHRKADVLVYGSCGSVEVREWKNSGKGLYAKEALLQGQEVFVFDGEKFIQREKGGQGGPIDYLVSSTNQNAIIVGREQNIGRAVSHGDFIWANPDENSPLRWLNHSCDPNILRTSRGMNDPFQFVASKPIAAGEQLIADYSLLETDPGWQMTCQCGSDKCRGVIRGITHLPAEEVASRWEEIPRVMQDFYIQRSTDQRVVDYLQVNGSLKTRADFIAIIK